MWSVTGLTKDYTWVFGVPIIGMAIGGYLDYQANLSMTKYRDKSALYGRELKPGEPPSWPTTYIN